MQMRRNTYTCSDNQNILDDVLTFESWYEEVRPSNCWQKKEWHDGRDHVNEQERNHPALCSRKEKEDTD